ncbi:MAG: magnesium transporter [Halolamina sp.]
MTVRDRARTAFAEAVPALSASAVGGLAAGVVLGGMRAELRAVEGLLVLVPALLATRGNVYGSLGARLSTGLHQGLIEPRLGLDDERVRAAVSAALLTGVGISVVAAAMVWVVLRGLGRPTAPMWQLVTIATIAGALSGIALTVVVVAVVVVGFRRGHNPDTLVGPVVTTAGDVFGMLFLLVAVRAVLALAGGGT